MLQDNHQRAHVPLSENPIIFLIFVLRTYGQRDTSSSPWGGECFLEAWPSTAVA